MNTGRNGGCRRITRWLHPNTPRSVPNSPKRSAWDAAPGAIRRGDPRRNSPADKDRKGRPRAPFFIAGDVPSPRPSPRLQGSAQKAAKYRVIPGCREAAGPEPIFQRPVFMGSGLAAGRRPGMTSFLCKAPPAGRGRTENRRLSCDPSPRKRGEGQGEGLCCSVQPIEPGDVFVGDLLLDALGEPGEVALQGLVRVRPDAVRVRVVSAPDDIVLADQGDDRLEVFVLLI